MSGFAATPLRIAVFAGLILAAATSHSSAQQRVGVNGAVNPDVTGAAPGAAPKRLVIGQDVIYNEHITTTASGQTQILFLDESSMTVGPNSDLTIDQFVYDPKTGTGKLAMSATRGLMRYVGGKLSKHDEAVTVRTSTATLAVRGGAFMLNIERDGKSEAIFIFGDGLTVSSLEGLIQTLTRPGYEIAIIPGTGALAPAPVPAGHLAQLNNVLDGRTGGTGGASVVPTDAAVVNSGVPQTISGNLPVSLQQAAANQPTTTVTSPPLVPVNTQQTITSQISTNPDCAIAGTCSPSVPVIRQVVTPPVAVSIAGRAKYTNGQGTSRGFIDESANGDIPYSSGSVQNGVFNASVGALGTVSFPLAVGSSSFSGTSSTLGAITGTSYLSSDGSFFYATITPTAQPAERIFLYGGQAVSSSFYSATGGMVLAFTIQQDAALQASIPFLRSQTGGNLAGATVSPLILATPAGSTFSASNAATKALQTSLAINGTGANQSSALVVAVGNVFTENGQPLLNGVVNGTYQASATSQPTRIFSPFVTPIDGSGNSFYGSTSISGFVLTNGNCCSGSSISQEAAVETNTQTQVTTTYGFSPPVTAATSVPSYATGTQTTQTLSGYFGGIMTKQSSTPLPYIVTGTSSISTSASNLQIAATFTGGDPFTSSTSGINSSNGLVLQFGSLTNGGTNARQAFIDDSLFAAERSPDSSSTVAGVAVPINSGSTDNSGSNVFMVTQTAAPPPTSLLPSGVSYCACQYLQWGYWGGELDTPAGTSTAARIDTANINFWVAGTPTSTADLNTLISQSATANYTGHAIGSVYNNGASYIAGGGFTGTYNFGTQIGSMSINNFDGHSFTASGSAPLNGANYSFTASGSGATGTINGSFFGPAAAETGGNFAFQTTTGPTYLASGIFAGKR